MEIRGGMAPTPETMMKMREISSAEEEEGETTEELIAKISLRGSPNSPTAKVNQLIWSTHWLYQKRILDLLEINCRDDRQWNTMRRVVMNIQNEHVEVLRTLVGQELRKLISKENADATDSEGSD